MLQAIKGASLLVKIGVPVGIGLALWVAYSVWIGGVKKTAKREGAQTIIIETQEKGLEDAKNVQDATNDFIKHGPSRADCLRDARNPQDCPDK